MRKLRHIMLLMLCLAAGTAAAQNLRLNPWSQSFSINTDVSDIFDFNCYEGARWGFGLNATIPFRSDTARTQASWSDTILTPSNALLLNGRAGYGVRDHAFKYHAFAAIFLPTSNPAVYSVSYLHDLQAVGGHGMENRSPLLPYLNSHYMLSRFSAVDRLSVGITGNIGKIGYSLYGLRSLESYLFDEAMLYYPHRPDAASDPHNAQNPSTAYPQQEFIEGLFTLRGGHGDVRETTRLYGRAPQAEKASEWRLSVLGGTHAPAHAVGAERTPYARILFQYARINKTLLANNRLRTFFELGITSSQATPYSRMFDLSGAGGSFYQFNETFMTVAPNTFMAHQFAHLCLNYRFQKPIWNLRHSTPLFSLQLNTMWGTSLGEALFRYDDGTLDKGSLYYHSLSQDRTIDASDLSNFILSDGSQSKDMPTLSHDLVHYYTPNRGLSEVGISLERILTTSWLDLGVSAAYQLAPLNASYHHSDPAKRFALMLNGAFFIKTL